MITAGIVTFIILNILGLYTFSWWHLLWMIPVLTVRVAYNIKETNLTANLWNDLELLKIEQLKRDKTNE